MTFDFSEASFEPRFYEAAARFTQELVRHVEALGLGDLSGSIDHVCYRSASVEHYEVVKRRLRSCAQLLSEAFINRRPIATYRLRQPVRLRGGSTIDVVELPSPKPGVPSKCGFEHIEIVTSEPLELFMSKHSRMPFNTANFGAAVNRDVSLTLPSGVVKFHEARLDEIIQREQDALRVREESHLVVIDLDDTLVDSGEYFLRAMPA